MKKIITILLSIVVVLVLIALAVPLVMGFWIEKEFPIVAARMVNSPNFTVKVTDYQRGWFSSNAKLVIGIQTHLLSINNLILNERIYHGPIICKKNPDGTNEFLFAKALFVSSAQVPGIDMKAATVWTWDDQFRSTFKSGTLTVGNPDQKFNIENLNGKINYNSSTQELQTRIALDHMQITPNSVLSTGAEKVDISHLGIKANLTKQNDAWMGARHLKIGNMTLTSQNGQKVNMDGINLAYKHNNEAQNHDLKIKYRMNHITGQKVNLSNLQLLLTFKNVNVDALEDFTERFILVGEEETPQNIAVPALAEPLMRVLSDGLTLDLQQLSFNTEDGPVNLSGQIQVPVQGAQVNLPYLVANTTINANAQAPQTWLNKQLILFYDSKNPNTDNTSTPTASNNTATTAQKSAAANQSNTAVLSSADQAKNTMDLWTKTNWVVLFDNRVQINLNYNKGQWLVNGKAPMDLTPPPAASAAPVSATVITPASQAQTKVEQTTTMPKPKAAPTVKTVKLKTPTTASTQ